MHGVGPGHLELVVLARAIELQGLDAARASACIEPAFRKEHADGIDAVLDAMQWSNSQILQSKAFHHLDPALSRCKLSRSGIMRNDVPGVDVRQPRKVAHVMCEVDAGCFVIIDDVDLATDDLGKPDRGGHPGFPDPIPSRP